jgi:hypothetical protein
VVLLFLLDDEEGLEEDSEEAEVTQKIMSAARRKVEAPTAVAQEEVKDVAPGDGVEDEGVTAKVKTAKKGYGY